MKKLDKIVFCIFAALAILYAGGKGRVMFPRTDPEVWYLVDAGSSVSNGSVHVRFTRNFIVPSSASVYMDGMDEAYTNQADWASHSFPAYSNRFDALGFDGFDFAYPAATGCNWIVYTDWTPSHTIHTNGVAFVVWRQGSSPSRLVTYRTGVYTNAVRLAPNPWITNSPPMPAIQLMTTEAPDE